MAVKLTKVDNPSYLIPIVEQRLPTSCFILNQLKFHEKSSDSLEIFSLGSGAKSDTWILTKYLREDYGMVISISAPNSPEPISPEIRNCFKSSGVIDWNKPFLFNSLTGGPVTKLITDINLEDLGKIITIYPCQLFHMEPSQALKLPDPPLPQNVQLKRLDAELGTPFISENWKYSKGATTTSFVRKSIQRFPSAGLLLNDTLVSGAITPAFGLISMLHTDPQQRRQGHASHVMRHIFREMAREGLEPCLTSEFENPTAINFHISLGLRPVSQVNFIENSHGH